MRRWAAAASLWCLALIACASPATGAADVPASGASRDDGSDVGSIDAGDAIGDATRAGRVAVVFVTSRDAESLSPCRAGLLRALRASVADLPDHDVFVLHGGDGTGPMAHRDPADDDVRLRPATMLSQSALKPLVPERLRCDCSSGNGATPFAFMAWLASTDSSASEDDASNAAAEPEPRAAERKKKEYAFAWYVEEDVVFTGNWAEVFRLRLVSTPESRVREVEVFGELSGSSVRPTANDDDRNANGGEPSEPSDVSGASDAAAFATSPVDVVAHVERVTGRWKKRCRMPGDGSLAQINGTGCVGHDGFVYSAWWPVIGMSRAFARALTDSVADERGANGHQEPLTMSFCRRMNHEHAKRDLTNDDVRSTDATFGFNGRPSGSSDEWSDSSRNATAASDDATSSEKPPCAFRLAPSDALGEYQLGHWGRFVGRPKSHPTFTAPGLTYGHNLALGRLYHPLKCEADAGIGALAAACAGAEGRGGAAAGAAAASSAAGAADAPRRALTAASGGGGGGGGGGEQASVGGAALSASLRETYFEKKPWALAFDDGGYGGRRAGERDGNGAEPIIGVAPSASGEKKSRLEADPEAYVAAKAAAKERNEALSSRARAAARPYARPVRGPKKKTSDTGHTA